MTSWKTTLGGALAALAVILPQLATLLDADPATNPVWSVVIAAVLGAIGLGAAKDHDVTGGTREAPKATA